MLSDAAVAEEEEEPQDSNFQKDQTDSFPDKQYLGQFSEPDGNTERITPGADVHIFGSLRETSADDWICGRSMRLERIMF